MIYHNHLCVHKQPSLPHTLEGEIKNMAGSSTLVAGLSRSRDQERSATARDQVAVSLTCIEEQLWRNSTEHSGVQKVLGLIFG